MKKGEAGILTIKEMQERKRELGLTNEELAERSGVPLGTVQKIFAGFTKAPRKKTIEALERILRWPAAEGTGYKTTPLPPMMVSEETAAYNADSRQGTYTIRDYYVLSEDRRMELIDGYIYDMASPTKIHQFILSQIYLQLAPCVDAHPGCMIYFAPLDVRLDNDDYTMVQPDLMILCDSADHDIRRVNGAPDFVIEILSASSRFHDMFRKLYKYKSAGVREYWIIDPEKKRVTVYDFEGDELPVSYDFNDKVPLIISRGECAVDFIRIDELLKQYFTV